MVRIKIKVTNADGKDAVYEYKKKLPETIIPEKTNHQVNMVKSSLPKMSVIHT